MKNLSATIIIILLVAIFLRLGIVFDDLKKSNQDLIAANQRLEQSNQRLEQSITNFSKQIDPIVKRFGR